MKIEIVIVKKKDKEILRKMIGIYEKEMMGDDAGEYKYFDCYWENKNRWPFFIMIDNKIIGFVLVNQHCLLNEGAKNLGEFYITKDYRLKGVGLEAANRVFKLFKGKWEVRQIVENPKAHKFWLKVIAKYTNDKFEDVFLNNENWHGWIQTFDDSMT